MRGFWAVYKRELKAYFTTPVAYVFLVVFLFFSAYLPFKDGFFENRQADLRLFFDWMPTLFVFLVPAVAMRLWAQERRSGSIELLLTLPVTILQAVAGKFYAAWTFLLLALALTAGMPITVGYLGAPDWGQIACGYAGCFLMAGGFLAIGCFFSALTKNQIVSFILTVVACAALTYAGLPSTLRLLDAYIPGNVLATVQGFSMLTHFESISRGVLTGPDLIYFLLMMKGWAFASMIVLQERKAA